MVFPDAVPTWALFAEMALAAAVVVLAGWRFARLADLVADRLHLGAGWIGLILLATVTSLPELVTSGTATLLGNVDLALGGILGSCSFNITIIFLLNAAWGGGSVLTRTDEGRAHTLSSAFGMLLIGLTLFGMVLMDKFAAAPKTAGIVELCWALLILIAYLFCMKLIHRYERRRNHADHRDAGPPGRMGAGLTLDLIVTAAVLIAASWWLANLGDALSIHPIEWLGGPLGATFVGACFLALATSLPEIATSISAVKIGKLDLALGNIFGSNMFNIVIIPVLKGLSLGGGHAVMLTPHASDTTQNLIAGLLAMLLTAVAIGGMAYRSHTRIGRFGFDSILIAAIYLGGMALLVTGTPGAAASVASP
ncbi:MAG: sodium:calcium antiporter [Planctomycetota bacterium]|nr:MAG: sodium:calcium antiporter [Planctomycetota bacterium]